MESIETSYIIITSIFILISIAEAIAIIFMSITKRKTKKEIELLGQILFILRNRTPKQKYADACWDEINKL